MTSFRQSLQCAACALALLIAFALAGATPPASAAGASRLQTFDYPRPVRYHPGDTVRDPYRNPDYVVRVRTPGGRWQDLFEHRVDVDWNNPQSASLVRFDFVGRVELAIQRSYSGFSKVAVRPAALGIKPRIADDTVYVTLDRPANFSVEFDGDKHHNLHVFAGAIDDRPRAEAPGVVVFGPGLHRPANGARVFSFGSGQTVLIDGAAVLEAGISLDNVHDVTIRGHGLIERPATDTRMNDAVDHDNSTANHIDGSAAIAVRDSRNVRIEGLTIIDPPGVAVGCMQSDGVQLVDLKAFSAGPWADGIDLYSCRDVAIDRVFLRVADDCFALYNARWGMRGDVRDVRVTNSTCWADVAHAMYMGLFGSKDRPEVTENIVFRDIDVLEVNETQPRFQGVMAINANNSTVVRNILFEDIRVDHIIEGKLFNFAVIGDDRFSLSPGGGIENVTLRRIAYTGKGTAGPSVVTGYDAARGVRGIVLDDVRIGGRKLLGPDPALLHIGPHADGIRFR